MPELQVVLLCAFFRIGPSCTWGSASTSVPFCPLTTNAGIDAMVWYVITQTHPKPRINRKKPKWARDDMIACEYRYRPQIS